MNSYHVCISVNVLDMHWFENIYTQDTVNRRGAKHVDH